MKRFFNMIPGQSDCSILLYGNIDYYDTRSGEITRELLEAEAAYQKIDFRINSMGGDVYTGIALFNALQKSKADITMYIDGVAASMASVIALCGKPVYMSKYARLMIHGVSGGCYGNVSDLEACLQEIKILEATLCDMFAKKLNLTPEEVRATYFDGKDHWLTADEALSLGIIDGIYDADPVPEDSTPEQVYALYQNKYSNSQKTENNMFEKLKKRPSFANCASDEDVLKRIDELETDAAKVPGLEKTNGELKTEVDGYKQKEVEAQEAADETLVNTAFDEGRITEPEKAVYRAALKADRDNATNALKTLPAKRRVMDNLATPPAEGESEWAKRQREIKEKNAKK